MGELDACKNVRGFLFFFPDLWSCALQTATEKMIRTEVEAALDLEPGSMKSDPELKAIVKDAVGAFISDGELPTWVTRARLQQISSEGQVRLLVYPVRGLHACLSMS